MRFTTKFYFISAVHTYLFGNAGNNFYIFFVGNAFFSFLNAYQNFEKENNNNYCY